MGLLKLDFWVLEGRNRLVHIELRFKVSKSGPSSVWDHVIYKTRHFWGPGGGPGGGFETPFGVKNKRALQSIKAFFEIFRSESLRDRSKNRQKSTFGDFWVRGRFLQKSTFGDFGIGMNFLRSQKIVLLPTNAVAFAARSWDFFFLVPNNFLWFQKIVGSQQMRRRICCSPLVFSFSFFFVGYLGWRFLIRILLPFGRDSSLASNVEPKIATIENFKSLREWKFATVTTFRRFARSQKKEPRWRLAAGAGFSLREHFRSFAIFRFCDFDDFYQNSSRRFWIKNDSCNFSKSTPNSTCKDFLTS